MIDELEANALKAQDTYKGTYIEVTGELSVIDSAGSYIALKPTDKEFTLLDVQCFTKNADQKAQVLNMSKGDTVTLRGKCTKVGEVMGYSLDIDSIDGYDITEIETPEATNGYIVVTADELVEAMDENAHKAQVLYKGQELEVTGKLSNIDSDGKYINIDPENNPYSFVIIQCYIKSDDVKSVVMDLNSDDVITVKGKCKDVGELLGYSINIESIEKK